MFLNAINFKFPPKYEHLHSLFEVLFWASLFFVSLVSILPSNANLNINQNIFAAISNWLFATPIHHDKVSHFIAYGGLAGLGVLSGLKPFGYKRALLFILMAWSAFIELIQSFAKGRVGDILDLAANVSGVIAGAIGAILIFTVLTRLTAPRKGRV